MNIYKYFFKQPKPSTTTYEFKMEHTFDKRKADSSRILSKYPDVIPIIIEKSDRVDIPNTTKSKFLAKHSITVGQLLVQIRKELKIDHKYEIYLFVNNTEIPSITTTMKEVYDKYKDKDGFLYITYSTNN
jgi:GABA(A) receptor-associated protein